MGKCIICAVTAGGLLAVAMASGQGFGFLIGAFAIGVVSYLAYTEIEKEENERASVCDYEG